MRAWCTEDERLGAKARPQAQAGAERQRSGHEELAEAQEDPRGHRQHLRRHAASTRDRRRVRGEAGPLAVDAGGEHAADVTARVPAARGGALRNQRVSLPACGWRARA